MTNNTNFNFQTEFIKNIKNFISFLIPIIYLGVWYLFIKFVSLDTINNQDLFLTLSFLILVFGIITKSAIWSIGHEKFGIKGDSRSKVINYHKNEVGDSWFDLYGDNPDIVTDKEVQQFIKELAASNKE